MTLRSDSWGTTSEVKAYTRYLANSTGTFNSTTRPTNTDLEKFIDRISGTLNVQLWAVGFNPVAIRANSTAKLACDDFVVTKAAAYAELTQRGEGFGPEEASRYGAFLGLYQKDLNAFLQSNILGWKYMGITTIAPSYGGLDFTALDAYNQRVDPQNPNLAQPTFRRNQFNDPTETNERESDNPNGDI